MRNVEDGPIEAGTKTLKTINKIEQRDVEQKWHLGQNIMELAFTICKKVNK